MTSLHCWLDSSVALHWILGGGDYKQFVANRYEKLDNTLMLSGGTYLLRIILQILLAEVDW